MNSRNLSHEGGKLLLEGNRGFTQALADSENILRAVYFEKKLYIHLSNLKLLFLIFQVSLLRRAQRRISQNQRNNPKAVKNQKLNTNNAKKKWQCIEGKITKVALQKQAVSQMENDMDRWLKEREKLSHKLERMR